jgi:hypothetical protein
MRKRGGSCEKSSKVFFKKNHPKVRVESSPPNLIEHVLLEATDDNNRNQCCEFVGIPKTNDLKHADEIF